MILKKCKKPNDDIRQLVKDSGFCAWQVSEKLNCSDNTYFRLLRKELSAEDKQMIFEALNQLKAEEQESLLH